MAAACGSSSGKTSSSAETVDPNGVLKIGMDLNTGAGIYFDITVPISVPQIFHNMIYDTLLRPKADGSLGPGLAKSATIVDVSTIKVELQPNVTFTDGTPMDAAAVKFSIERNISQGKAGSFETEFLQVQDITVDSPTVLTIRLKTPIAGAWYRMLRLGETSPVSPTAVKAQGADFNLHPVGAGPFKLDSIVTGQQINLVKSPTFFEHDKIKLAGIQIMNVSSASSVTAMRSGTVDWLGLGYTQAKELEGAGLSVQQAATSDLQLEANYCKSRPPFSDLRVRQALNYALDRDAINTAVYDGKGEAMWGLNLAASPFHDPSDTNFYKYDPAKAKQLLADAGFPKLDFDAFITPGTDAAKAAEVIQQQWSQVGVTIHLKPLSNVTDFYPNGQGAPMYIQVLQRAGLNKVTRVWAPGSYGNVCQWSDPVLNGIIDEMRKVSETSSEATPIWKRLEKQALTSGVAVFGLFGVQVTAISKRVGNVSFIPNNLGSPYPNFYDISIKK
jgi:ABC-type transport system substrate-binding protein